MVWSLRCGVTCVLNAAHPFRRAHLTFSGSRKKLEMRPHSRDGASCCRTMEEMEDSRGYAPIDTSSDGTVADEAGGCRPEQNKKADSRHMQRLKKLKTHHDKCETRYKKANAERLQQEREKTVALQRSIMNTTKVPESSSDSEGTDILDPTPPDVLQDKNVPELRRIDSVILTREMLGYLPEKSVEFSEDDYVPDSAEDTESNSSAEDVNLKRTEKKLKKGTSKTKKGHVQPRKQIPVTGSSTQDADDSGESSSPDSSDVTVKTLKTKEHGGRLYDKKSYCVFCFKPFSKMARHLESLHKDKPEVARAVACPKGSKERRIQLTLLRNRGNRIHNNEVLKERRGMVIPRQQSTAPVTASDYMHCVNCEAYLKRRSLWKHMRRCHLHQKVVKPGKTKVQAVCSYAQPVPDNVNARFWKVVLDMHTDEVTDVRKEKSILTFGEHLFNKHGHDVTKHEYVRQKMRETGRLVLQAKENGKLKMMSDFFVPNNFPYVLEAVKNVAGFNEETNTYKTPSLALKLGHNLKKIANIVECEAMMSGDENAVHNVKMFRHLCDTKWNECVSSQALRTLSEAKWNAPQLLPFTEDVKKMHHYLSIKRKEWQTELEEEPNKKNWAELAKITLCEVILFNRRREGEVSKMSLNAFILRDASATHPDVELALSDLEKKLCKHFQQVEIKGKRGRKVPILLTPDMQASMELLVKTRSSCDVADENHFMFARPEALSHFRASDVIRQIARNCGASHPEALSSTKLRKHMATMSKILNLKDNEMDDLADFLGHDIRVHRQYYRLPEGTLQLAKISKVLMALERGQMSKYQGRNLDEIHIDPQENMAADRNASDMEEEDDSPVKDAESPSPSSSQSSDQSRVKKKSTTEVERSSRPPPAKGIAEENVLLVEKATGKSCRIKGASGTKRRKWSDEEIQAVEKTLMHNINSGQVPGKAQCMNCVNASPVALQGRSWDGIKFYVKNRIDAAKREAMKRR